MYSLNNKTGVVLDVQVKANVNNNINCPICDKSALCFYNYGGIKNLYFLKLN